MKSYEKIIFKRSEILRKDDFYKFIDRKKIAVYVPFKFADKLIQEMSRAEAGLIGNYEMCSFRTAGTGTFKPNSKANPYSGRKNKISFAEEFKLEMECASEKLNGVIDAVLKFHPYDEAVYEVYDFKKRDSRPSGKTIHLKSRIKYSTLKERISKFVNIESSYSDFDINKAVIVNINIDSQFIQSAKYINCDCLISKFNQKINLIKI